MKDLQQLSVFVVLLAPLASFLAACVLPSRYRKAIGVVCTGCLLLALVTAVLLFYFSWGTETRILRADWFAIGTLVFDADLALSNHSLLMLVVVSFVSFLVHLYSISYMADDAGWKKYFAMLGFFTFSMQGIVVSDNLLLLFIFWELVGFSSYMLIGHWHASPEAGRAATKAFVMNRIGDAGFLVGLMILWATHGTFSITEITAASGAGGWQTAAGICLFCGVIGKSAQFPLFTWLPDAMEGPTPVSALIHAATMVAAGVYLLVRTFSLFTEDALIVIAVTGMITTVAGALAALSQYDIKKILAYSTMSQLGLMILALGMGIKEAAFLHLLTHAFFKACLFLSAGAVIHSLHQAMPSHLHFNVQDIRNMGGLRKKLPLTFTAFLISGASLAGVPFFSGFLSKEAILTAVFVHPHAISWLMLVVVVIVSFLTVLYTFRLIWFVFMGEARAAAPLTPSEPGLLMRAPVAILALGSLWFSVSWNPFDYHGWMSASGPTTSHGVWITLFSIAWVVAAIVLGWYLFRKENFRTNALLRQGFLVDRLYTTVITHTLERTPAIMTYVERRWIDRGLHAMVYVQVMFAHIVGWIDRAIIDGAVNATARVTGFGGRITRSFQGGNIQLYIFWSLLTIIIFIIWTLN